MPAGLVVTLTLKMAAYCVKPHSHLKSDDIMKKKVKLS